MAQPPPDLEHAPDSWKKAFKALKDYAVQTGLSNVTVTVKKSDGSEVPAYVELKPSSEGITVKITLPP